MNNYQPDARQQRNLVTGALFWISVCGCISVFSAAQAENLNSAKREHGVHFSGDINPQCRLYPQGSLDKKASTTEMAYNLRLNKDNEEFLFEAEMVNNAPGYFRLSVNLNLSDKQIIALKKAHFVTSIRIGLPVKGDDKIEWKPWRSFVSGLTPVYEIKDWALDPKYIVQVKHRIGRANPELSGFKAVLACIT